MYIIIYLYVLCLYVYILNIFKIYKNSQMNNRNICYLLSIIKKFFKHLQSLFVIKNLVEKILVSISIFILVVIIMISE